MNIQDEIERLRREYEERRSTRVKVALFGQPGAGKSSLINERLGAAVAKGLARTRRSKPMSANMRVSSSWISPASTPSASVGNDFLETCHAVAQEALRVGLKYDDGSH
jgi:GTPase SAR1 family protein